MNNQNAFKLNFPFCKNINTFLLNDLAGLTNPCQIHFVKVDLRTVVEATPVP
jgi:hypothetical protein